MHPRVHPLLATAAASWVTVGCCFGFVMGYVRFNNVPRAMRGFEKVIAVIVFVLLVAGVSTWLFRALRKTLTVREARAGATSFAVFLPICLCVALAVVGQIAGGYAEQWWGTAFALIGAFIGVLVATTLMTAAGVMIAVRISRQSSAFF